MSIQYEGSETEESEASRKRRWLVVAMLFFLTLGGTVAARLAAGTNSIPGFAEAGDLTREVRCPVAGPRSDEKTDRRRRRTRSIGIDAWGSDDKSAGRDSRTHRSAG